MQYFTFMLEYIKHPRVVGAFAPSSKKLTKKMVSTINFQKAKTIVEIGPGTGVFTREIAKRKLTECKLVLIELNQSFATQLKKEYENDKSVIVIHGSAEHIQSYLRDMGFNRVDYVISGLPFASLPKSVSAEILTNSKQVLDKNGKFITFQYSLFKKQFVEHFFPKIEINKVWVNFPPAYVFSCRKAGE